MQKSQSQSRLAFTMKYKIVSKKELPKSLLEIEVEIAWESVASYESEVIKDLTKHMELPGFRKGHVPENMLRNKVGDQYIVEDMAEKALQEVFSDIIDKEDVNSIGRPNIVFTKVARDNPVSIRITLAIVPKAELPDYKKIAKETKEESVNINDEDVEKFIEELRKNYARSTHTYKEGHNHDHEHKDEDLVLPEVNDDFVKKLGAFETVEDFKTKLKENLLNDKTARAKDKRRADIAEKIIAETKLEIPDILVESELDRMLGQFEGDITKSGMKMEDYLKHINKKVEDIRSEWTTDAEKRAKLKIILAEIALKEKIIPEESKVKEQYDEILRTYSDADPMRVKLYVEQEMTNSMVFDFLESQK